MAAALYAVSELPDDQLLAIARSDVGRRSRGVLRAYVGDRGNRRHKPGRAFERTTYRFDVLADYGAFRDLQRHRLLTLEWQPLGALHGYVEPDAIEEAGAHEDWTDVMERSAELHDALHAAGLSARRAVRRVDGVSDSLLHGHERARGDAPHRAAHGAAGTSGLPPHLPGDAPLDRRTWPATALIAEAMQFADHSRSSSSGCRPSGR